MSVCAIQIRDSSFLESALVGNEDEWRAIKCNEDGHSDIINILGKNGSFASHTPSEPGIRWTIASETGGAAKINGYHRRPAVDRENLRRVLELVRGARKLAGVAKATAPSISGRCSRREGRRVGGDKTRRGYTV